MIALDLSQLYNQVLLITYLKFTKKNAKGAWKEKKTKSVCNFIGLKSHKLNYECKKCKKRWKTLLMKIIHMLKKTFEELKLKNLGDYHDLYAQSDTLCLQLFWKTLETSVLKYMNSILLIFCLHQD